MATISLSELKRRVEAFNVAEEAGRIIAANTKTIADLNKAQMFQGLHGQGGQIGRYKDVNYAEEKYEQNPAAGFGNVDLRLTGSFYDKIEARMNGSGTGASLEIGSTDAKAEKLTKKYGKGIHKLTVGSKNIVRKQILQPSLVHRFVEKTGTAQIG